MTAWYRVERVYTLPENLWFESGERCYRINTSSSTVEKAEEQLEALRIGLIQALQEGAPDADADTRS